MRRGLATDQSIIISGESGAGKVRYATLSCTGTLEANDWWCGLNAGVQDSGMRNKKRVVRVFGACAVSGIPVDFCQTFSARSLMEYFVLASSALADNEE